MRVAFSRVRESYPALDSTNDRALAWAREGAPHGALVTAAQQTAGRGRRGRHWSSPESGDLYVSVILHPAAYGPAAIPSSGWGAYGLAVAVALREGLLAALPADDALQELALKWPNDLLWRGRKLAGILCEGRWHGGRLETIVAGIGVNVGRRAFPPELAAQATSLRLIAESLGLPPPLPSAEALLDPLLTALEGITADFAGGGLAAIRPRYEPHSLLLGREVESAGAPGERGLRGLAVGLDHDGALLIATTSGRRRLEAADVWLATAPAIEPGAC